MRRLVQGGLRNLCIQVFGSYVGCHLAWRPAAGCRFGLGSGTAISGCALDIYVFFGGVFCMFFLFFILVFLHFILGFAM